MSGRQKILLAVFLFMTMIILILDNLFPGDSPVYYIKYGTVVSLFVVALAIRKRYREQVIMNLALFFAAVGDFFLNFCNVNPALAVKVVPFGMAGFTLSYLLLIAAWLKNFKPGVWELVAAIPVLGVYIPVFITLVPYVRGAMFYAAVLFGIVLCFMAWTSISTLFGGYYSSKVSHRTALAGYLIFLSDIAVAFVLFHPAFAGTFVPWLENIIWLTYIPAWTLIVTTIAEEDLVVPQKTYRRSYLPIR